MKLPGFMRRFTVAAFGLLAAGLAAVPASAQDVGAFAGQWYCKYSMQPFSGNALDKHYWEFQLALYQNGGYEMQGFYYNSVVGQIPVQGGGQWGPSNEGGGSNLHMQGRLLRQDSGWMPFELYLKAADANSLYFQFKGNTHMTNVTCQR